MTTNGSEERHTMNGLSPQTSGGGRKWLIIGIVVVLAILAIGAIVALLPSGPLGSGLTPEELAERHINDQIDAIGETIAGFLILSGPGLLKELGRRVH